MKFSQYEKLVKELGTAKANELLGDEKIYDDENPETEVRVSVIETGDEKDAQTAEKEVQTQVEKAVQDAIAANAEKAGPQTQMPANKASVVAPRWQGNLKAFKDPATGRPDPEKAYKLGMGLLASIDDNLKGRFNDPQLVDRARQYCKDHGIYGLKDAYISSTDAQGGFIVPTVLEDVILHTAKESGVTMATALNITMTSDKHDLNELVEGLTVEGPSQAASITESNDTYNDVSLVALGRKIRARISNELNEVAIVNQIDRLAARMAEELQVNMDEAYISGDGTAGSPEFGVSGLLDSLGAAGQVTGSGGTWDTLVLADFNKLVGTLPDRYHRRNPSWIVSRAFFAQVMQKLAYAAGGNTVFTLSDGTLGNQFLGFPVHFTEHMPTSSSLDDTVALFGAYDAGAAVGVRVPGRFEVSGQDAHWAEDAIGVRGVMHYDIQVVKGGDGSNAGAYVGLKTAASS